MTEHKINFNKNKLQLCKRPSFFYCSCMDMAAVFLGLYQQGKFPMADSSDATETYIFDPPERTLIPLDLHIPRSLSKIMKRGGYEIHFNTAFADVMAECRNRKDTWINQTILDAFLVLHKQGHAHSVEYWQNGTLCGGLYGLQVGAVFCGESMFSLVPNASKACLVALCQRLKERDFKILDAQFMNDHLRQFGAYTVERKAYLESLAEYSGLNRSLV